MGKKSSAFFRNGVLAIGVDISKATLDIAYLCQNQQVFSTRIANTSEAIALWVHELVDAGYAHKIIVESTARYHYLLAWQLSEQGQDVRVINPLLSSKHSKGQIRKIKSDRQDALILAQMALTEPKLPPPQRITQHQLQLRQKMGLLQSVDKQMQSLSRMVGDYQQSSQTLTLALSPAEQDLLQLVEQLRRTRKQLEHEMEALMAAQHHHPDEVARLVSLPGISRTVGQLILTFLRRDVTSAKSWQAFVGLDVSVRESGTWRGKGHLTKRGNPYLRKRLYCAAWGAYMHYPEVRVYYDGLKSQGRAHKEALVIIARKLLGMAFAVLKNQTLYDPKRAFMIS